MSQIWAGFFHFFIKIQFEFSMICVYSESRFPKESIAKLSELGLMGIPWDTKYGGGGMDTLSLVIVIEELAKVCVSTAATLMAHTSLGTGPFYYFGKKCHKNRPKKYIF